MTHKKRERGSAIVEFALVAPMLFFLLLAAVDCGLYTYAFIAVQNAARVGALRNSSGLDSASDQSGACSLVMDELRGLPNTAAVSSCNASPVTVSASLLCSTSPCTSTPASADGQPAALVTVSYSLPAVFEVPVVGPVTITRAAQMKIRSIQ